MPGIRKNKLEEGDFIILHFKNKVEMLKIKLKYHFDFILDILTLFSIFWPSSQLSNFILNIFWHLLIILKIKNVKNLPFSDVFALLNGTNTESPVYSWISKYTLKKSSSSLYLMLP